MSGLNIPADVIRQQIASGVHILIQIDRFPDGSRKVSRISEVLDLDEHGDVNIRDIYYFEFQGVDPQTQECLGHHTGCGVTPLVHKEFTQLGLQIPEEIYNLKSQ